MLAALFYCDLVSNGLEMFRTGLDPRFFNLKLILMVCIGMTVISLLLLFFEFLNIREKNKNK